MALDRRGRFLWGSPRATEAGKAILPELNKTTDQRPELTAWLVSAMRRPLTQIPPFEIGETSLQVVGISTGDEILARIVPNRQSTLEQRLASTFGLTAREAEVLFRLGLGKINRDIGEILAPSARTVNKHLQQIFQKMGVDNRTSAAELADRIINSQGA